MPEATSVKVFAPLMRWLLLSISLAALSSTALAQRAPDAEQDTRSSGGYLSSSVWVDDDRNGMQDKNERGLAGVPVSLLQCDGSFLRAERTDANGQFSFSRLAPGCYRLRFSHLDGYRFCPPHMGQDRRLDSDADAATGLTDAFEIGVNETLGGLDAGVVPVLASELGDRVWEDLNANGVQDVGEPGLAGAGVSLLSCSAGPTRRGGDALRSTVTQSNGYFVFEGLQADCYVVQIAPPPGFAFSPANATHDRFDSDFDVNTGIAQTGFLGAGEGQFDVDAGLFRTGSIGDYVWLDSNANNTQNANESGLPGVQVLLLDDQAGPLGLTTQTDVNGFYQFSNVTPGDYVVQFILPGGYAFVDNAERADSETDSDANTLGITSTITLLSNQDRDDIDAGAVTDGIPRLSLEKLTNGEDADGEPGPFIEAGDDVLWEYVVTNVGAGPLFNLNIVDDQGVSVSCPDVDLEEGESVTCTGATTSAQFGQYMNEGYACAAAGSPSGGLRCDKDVSHYFGSAPSIALEKLTNGEDADTPTGPEIPVGNPVMWEYLVTNTGNVELVNVTVTDDQGVVVTCPSMTLGPGVSMTCTGSGTAIAGQYANIGTVTGEPPIGDPVSDHDPSHYFGTAASIDIEKATNEFDADFPSGPLILVGDTVSWSYTVTNTGSITLTDIVVSDSDAGVTVTCPDTTLAPGDMFVCTATGTATLGQYRNDSGVVGQGVDENGDPVGPPVTDEDPSHYFGVLPEIDIEKATNGEDADTPTGPTIQEGELVTWTYVVTNIGNILLTDIVVTDDQGVTVTCPDTQLLPGASFTCTGTGTAQAGQYANLGTVVGQGVDGGEPIGDPVTDNDPSHYIGEPVEPGSLGDKVFKDLNGDGQQDAGEPGVAGFTVNLWTDDDGDGLPDTQIATTTTDAAGMYGFGDLDPTLTYVVQFVNDPGMNMPFTTPNVGDDTTDSDAGDGGITGPITLEPGENDPTIDAGIINLPASLGDKVFKDLNADGQQDAGEPGVAGFTVNLWTDDDGDGLPDTQIATTTTDAAGMYGFGDLDPTLTYVVQFVNDPGMNMPFTTPNVGDDATDSDAGDGGITGPITLEPGENDPTIDAGIINLPASLGDKVFKDLNADGQQDAGEPGVAGFTVNLWTDDDGDGLPDTQIATTTTDAAGMYGFGDLDPTLTYVVQFVNDPGMNMPFTTPNVGDDATDSDAGDGGITGPISLMSGENNPTIDAGIVNVPAKLGDFVFIDQDRDGIQDPGEPGVPDAVVNLWTDDDGDGNPDTQIASTTTDANGMYMFSNLTPGVAYIVQFEAVADKPFTIQNAGGNIAIDSDPEPTTGITSTIVLASGEFNQTIDAGVVMLNASIDIEKATNGVDADDPMAGDAPQLAPGDAVTWTYTVTNTGEVTLTGVVVDDDQGVSVNCPQSVLAPGEVITCTANGFADDLATTGFTTVLGMCGSTPNIPLYENRGRVVGQTITGTPVEDADLSHYCNAQACDVSVDLTCLVPVTPTSNYECDKPIDELTFIWDGSQAVRIKAYKGEVGSELLADIDNIAPGDEVTVTGFAGSPNDVYYEIFVAGTSSKLGESNFHLSCSDDAMDGPEDCGLPQGNGKSDDSDLINQWLLEGIVDAGGTLDCTATPEPGVDSCEIATFPASCETGNADFLTFAYTGGGCAASDNAQGDHECLGAIDDSAPVTVTDDDGNEFELNPGDTFTIERNDAKQLILTNGGGTQTNELHTSCSQPIVAGDVYGSLTLVQIDGQGIGADVVYTYVINNDGDTDIVMLEAIDDPLGPVPGVPATLAAGQSITLMNSAFITASTTNVVTVSATDASGASCAAMDDTSVTVLPPPPCEVSALEFDLSDDKFKWELINNGPFTATIERITLSWPAENGALEKVKFDGDIYDTPVNGPAVVLESDDFINDVEKRQLEPGKDRMLEFEFEHKAENAVPGDYEITVDFEEGCSVTFDSTAIDAGLAFECNKPIDALTMIYDGSQSQVRIKAYKGDTDDELLLDDTVNFGEEITVAGLAGSPNDVFWEVFSGSTLIGVSNFHLSCSDDDMADASDCGNRQGNGKSDDGDLLNVWLLEGMVDEDGPFDCSDLP